MKKYCAKFEHPNHDCAFAYRGSGGINIVYCVLRNDSKDQQGQIEPLVRGTLR